MVAAIRIGRGHVSNEPGVLTQDVGCGGTSAPEVIVGGSFEPRIVKVSSWVAVPPFPSSTVTVSANGWFGQQCCQILISSLERSYLSGGKFVAYYRVSTDRQGRSGLGLDARAQMPTFPRDWSLVVRSQAGPTQSSHVATGRLDILFANSQLETCWNGRTRLHDQMN